MNRNSLMKKSERASQVILNLTILTTRTVMDPQSSLLIRAMAHIIVLTIIPVSGVKRNVMF